MFKPSQPMMARLRLTTKQVGPGYYKGNRTGSMGHFLKPSSSYQIDWKKVRTYVVPENLSSFKLTPFVTKRMQPMKNIHTKQININGKTVTRECGLEGQIYLNEWGKLNTEEVLEYEEREKAAEAAKAEKKPKKPKKMKKVNTANTA